MAKNFISEDDIEQALLQNSNNLPKYFPIQNKHIGTFMKISFREAN